MPVPAKRRGSGDRRRKSEGGTGIQLMIIFSRKASDVFSDPAILFHFSLYISHLLLPSSTTASIPSPPVLSPGSLLAPVHDVHLLPNDFPA